MSPSHVVVDGSNIATEGRSTPSLRQLDEAIRQFQEEFPDLEVIVVVDATFGHRIDQSEREMFDEGVAHGELVSPPAGAIGRGDAFVLRVAERVDAQVLSNDSFQEFHGEHPWLFEEGRLIGGKPVPGVGWIFTPRLPVRGARSRAATAGGSGRADREVPADQSEPVPTASRSRNRRSGGQSKVAADAIALATEEANYSVARPKRRTPASESTATKTTKGSKTAKAQKEPVKAGKVDAPATAAKADKTAKATKRSRTAKAAKEPDMATKSTKAEKASKAEKADKAGKVEKADKATKRSRTAKAKKAPGKTVKKATKDATAADTEAETTRSSSRRRRRGRGTGAPAVRAAIEAATEEALHAPDESPPPSASGPSRNRSRTQTAPAAVNDPLTFLTFVTEHPVASSVLGTVSSFVSHGAMVDVDGMSCYLPLTGLGDPPPRRAREVVERGEQRTFVIVALDPPRRGAELALPELAPALMARSVEPVEPVEPVVAPESAKPAPASARKTKRAGPTASKLLSALRRSGSRGEAPS